MKQFIILLFLFSFVLLACTPQETLLLKGGTNKTICNGFSYNNVVFVDNWYNSEGLLDNCEMPPNASMDFAFKQHDQSLWTHTGTIKIEMTLLSEMDYYAVQVLTSNSTGGYAESWDFCGNIDEIRDRKQTVSIECSGSNLKFIKIVNAGWNDQSIYVDTVKVSSVSGLTMKYY